MVRTPEGWSTRRIAGAVGAVLVVGVVAFFVLGTGGGGDAGDGGPAGTDPGGTAPGLGGMDLPPGINESGVSDSDALLSAHREAAAESGFAYRYVNRRFRTDDNGTTTTEINVTGSVRASANLSAVRTRVERSAPVEETVVTWTNGSAGGERTVANGTTYESYSDDPTQRATLHYNVPNLLSLARWNLTEVRDDGGEPRFVFTANATRRVRDDEPANEDLSREQDVSARLVVDPEGRIRYFEVNLTERAILRTDDERIVESSTRIVVYELTSVGNVSVPPPEWLNRTDGTRVVPPRDPTTGTPVVAAPGGSHASSVRPVPPTRHRN